MPAREHRHRSAGPFRGWALVVLLCVLGPARAEEEGVYYSNKTYFRIPFQIDPGDHRVARVILHVSEDRRNWQQVATAAPTDRGFNYTARRDGWYFFTVQTADQEQKLYPPNLDNVAPGLSVYVDTVPPEVKLRPLTGLAQGQVGVEWDLRDATLDLSTMRLEYRLPNQLWQERSVPRQDRGELRWTSPGPGTVEVRLQVKDKAGNIGEATTRVRADGRGMERADEPPMSSNPPGGQGDGQPPLIKVNSTKISLNYTIEDIGPSNVSLVEIWMTPDGRSWQKTRETKDTKPPFVIDIEGKEGKYGFTLLAKSGVGLGEHPPRPGDPPQVWVEVDLTKPEVTIKDIRVGRGLEKDNLTIEWDAKDKNLKRQPITLSTAPKPEGPWAPIPGATDLENSGKFVWRMPENVPYLFYLRVAAADEAGNVGVADWRESVKVDLSLPKVRVLNVEPVKQP